MPHLCFDKEAKEAAEFYVSVFPNSKVINITQIHNTPSGDCDVVTFEIAEQKFMSISAGPLFKFNPSISFHFRCSSVEEVDSIWKKLAEGGTVLMELGEYPFSKRFGWLADKYGLSWQIIYTGDQPIQQRVIPAFTFVKNVYGKTEEAVNFYTKVFSEKYSEPSSQVNTIMRYGKGMEPDREGNIQYSSFNLFGTEFVAMESAHDHAFAFNEAISFIIPCESQEEIDYFWEKLSADPKAEQCGWLTDKFGVSWQVWPTLIGEIMRSGDQKKIDRVTQAFLQMKKFDIATLKKAFEGK